MNILRVGVKQAQEKFVNGPRREKVTRNKSGSQDMVSLGL